MPKKGYTGISVKNATRDRLSKYKITAGEYWDDFFDRILNELDKLRKKQEAA